MDVNLLEYNVCLFVVEIVVSTEQRYCDKVLVGCVIGMVIRWKMRLADERFCHQGGTFLAFL